MSTTGRTSVEPNTRVTGYRIVQYVLDTLLAGLLLAAVGAVADRVAPGAGFETVAGRNLTEIGRVLSTAGRPWPSLAAFLLTLAVWAAVFVAVPLRWDRTPAMALLRMRIVRLDGGSPTAWQHVLRAVFLIVDGAGAGLLGWIVILCSRRRQRVGDHAADTLVVRG